MLASSPARRISVLTSRPLRSTTPTPDRVGAMRWSLSYHPSVVDREESNAMGNWATDVPVLASHTHAAFSNAVQAVTNRAPEGEKAPFPSPAGRPVRGSP